MIHKGILYVLCANYSLNVYDLGKDELLRDIALQVNVAYKLRVRKGVVFLNDEVVQCS